MSQYNVKAYEINGHSFNFPKSAEVLKDWEDKQVHIPVYVEEKKVEETPADPTTHAEPVAPQVDEDLDIKDGDGEVNDEI